MNRAHGWIIVLIGVFLTNAGLQAQQANTRPMGQELKANRLIAFDGTLKDANGQLRLGTVRITFTIYGSQEGEEALWQESQTVQTDEQGRYGVFLGITEPEGLPLEVFSSGKAQWLGVQVEGEEGHPRVLLVAVPYALKAADADTVGGKSLSSFMVNEDQAKPGFAGIIRAQGIMFPDGTIQRTAGGGVAVSSAGPAKAGTVLATGDGAGANLGADVAGNFSRVSTEQPANKAITGVKAGTGPSGGATSGALTLSAWGGYFEGNLCASGNIGIGTTNPSRKVHILGSGPRILIETNDGYNPEVNFGSSGTSDWAIYKSTATGDLRFYQDGDQFVVQNSTGNIGIGTGQPPQKLTVRGNVAVQSAATGDTVIEMGEGLDYAEGFHVSDKTNIKPGSILVIDSDHPGKLKLSQSGYDTKVAGIVAGANGMGSAVRLGAGRFDYDVALAGRVYCNVDSSYGEVSPGDLLTTSPTPGYAMVVKDHAKAKGAILGKAMERLPAGNQAQILVLVTLQ